MDILCADTRLNISRGLSEAWLRLRRLMPAEGSSGASLHCALDRRADAVLDATLDANEDQLRKAYSMMAQIGARRVGIVGLSFKSDTDDLRESPLVELAEAALR